MMSAVMVDGSGVPSESGPGLQALCAAQLEGDAKSWLRHPRRPGSYGLSLVLIQGDTSVLLSEQPVRVLPRKG